MANQNFSVTSWIPTQTKKRTTGENSFAATFSSRNRQDTTFYFTKKDKTGVRYRCAQCMKVYDKKRAAKEPLPYVPTICITGEPGENGSYFRANPDELPHCCVEEVRDATTNRSVTMRGIYK